MRQRALIALALTGLAAGPSAAGFCPKRALDRPCWHVCPLHHRCPPCDYCPLDFPCPLLCPCPAVPCYPLLVAPSVPPTLEGYAALVGGSVFGLTEGNAGGGGPTPGGI